MKNRTFQYVVIAAALSVVSIPLVRQAANAQQSAAPNPIAPPATPAPAAPGGLPGLPPPATQPAVDPSKVVITVGDSKITAGDFDSFLNDLDPGTRAKVLSQPEGKRKLAEEMVKLKILSAEARKQKLDQLPKTQIGYDELLANVLLTQMAAQTQDDQKFFNDHKDYFDEVKARHILIAVVGSSVPGAKYTDAQAKAKAEEIKKRLDKGEDFAAIARTESDDKASGMQGGNLGNVSRGMMVPPFEEAAFALQKGQVSPPVKTQFGYHIIQVMDRTPSTYEDARQRIPMRRMDLLVEEAKRASKPLLDDSYFGPDPSAPASAAASNAQPAGAKLIGGK